MNKSNELNFIKDDMLNNEIYNKNINTTIKNIFKNFLFIFVFLFIFSINNNSYADDNSSETIEELKKCYKGDLNGKGLEIINTAINVISIIPAFSVIGHYTTYFEYISKLLVSIPGDFANNPDNVLKFLLDLANFIIGNPGANIIFQSHFGTNQYCQYQDLYKEEDSFLDADNKRYSIFPVIPIEIGINERGQCDVEGIVKDNIEFVEMLSAGFRTPQNSKCSYSYTNLNPTCVNKNIALVVLYETAKATTELVCMASNPSDSGSRALEIISKVGTGLMEGFELVLNVFALPIFEFDFYSLAKYYSVTGAGQFLSQVIVSAAELNFVCLISAITAMNAYEIIFPATVDAIIGSGFTPAKKALKQLRFCGYDWYSYTGIKNGIKGFVDLNDSPEYYERGPFEYSYSHAVTNCINNKEDNCNELNNNFGEVKIGTKDDIIYDKTKNFYKGIDFSSKDIKNKIYREYLYNGKEYILNYELEEGKENEESENRKAYDPRLPSKKGYYDVSHRYYMRGNEKANYACERFNYDGNGCVLRENDILDEDKTKFESFEQSNVNFYIVSGENYSDKYEEKCRDRFNTAYEECYLRSKRYVCIENIINNENKFCKSTYETDPKERMTVLSLILNSGEDKDGLCTVSVDNGNDAELLSVKQEGNNYICVFSNNYCPYDFKLNAGLNYKASYCESDYTNKYVEDGEDVFDITNYKYKTVTNLDANTCSAGIFNKNTCNLIKEGGNILGTDNEETAQKAYAFDMLKENLGKGLKNKSIPFYEDDFLKIYNGTNKKAAYDNIKNFCQYKAHCVKVEKEEIIDRTFDKVSAFIDMSCSGKNVHSRNFFNVGLEASSTRQLSATVVECVYESLKNLVSGVAGFSLCKGSYVMNNEGYCGSDSKQTVENKIKNGDFEYLNNKYHFIKGYDLPEDMNPFLKIQRNIRKLIITFLTLSFMLYGFKLVFYQHKKIRDFADKNFLKEIMTTIFKFTLVSWLALGTGWREGLSDKLFGFVASTYEFTNRIFLDSFSSEHSKILKDKVLLGIEKTDNHKDKSSLICFKVDKRANTEFISTTESPSIDGCTDSGVLYTEFSKNQEISAFTYFINNLNKQNASNSYRIAVIESEKNNNGELILKTANTNDNISNTNNIYYRTDTEAVNGIWDSNYDGCYFDESEYESSKNYLALFDSIDCRIVRYLGFAPNLNIANILLVPLFLTFFSTAGALLLTIVITFVFTIFNLMIEVIFVFVMSFFTLSLMIFLSPIILPMALFKRTESIFKGWLKSILSCIFQPVLVTAIVLIFLSLLDNLVLKNTIFEKHNAEGRYPNMICPDNVGLFCLINDTKKAFVVAKDTISDGFNLLTSLVKGNFDVADFPIILLLIDIFMIFILFQLGQSIISYGSKISEHLFGSTGGLTDRTGGNIFNNASNSASAIGKEYGGLISKNVNSVFSRPFAKIWRAKEWLGNKVNKLEDKAEKRNVHKKAIIRNKIDDLYNRARKHSIRNWYRNKEINAYNIQIKNQEVIQKGFKNKLDKGELTQKEYDKKIEESNKIIAEYGIEKERVKNNIKRLNELNEGRKLFDKGGDLDRYLLKLDSVSKDSFIPLIKELATSKISLPIKDQLKKLRDINFIKGHDNRNKYAMFRGITGERVLRTNERENKRRLNEIFKNKDYKYYIAKELGINENQINENNYDKYAEEFIKKFGNSDDVKDKLLAKKINNYIFRKNEIENLREINKEYQNKKKKIKTSAKEDLKKNIEQEIENFKKQGNKFIDNEEKEKILKIIRGEITNEEIISSNNDIENYENNNENNEENNLNKNENNEENNLNNNENNEEEDDGYDADDEGED